MRDTGLFGVSTGRAFAVAGLSEAGILRCALHVAVNTLCIAILTGCSGSPGPETVEVTGTVTVGGTPVEGANVIFHPLEGGERMLASQAVTNTEGRFELATHVGSGKYKPGIAPGKYAVVITKLDTAAISTTFAPPQNLLPKKYSIPATSNLTANVAAGKENDFKFTLDAN